MSSYPNSPANRSGITVQTPTRDYKELIEELQNQIDTYDQKALTTIQYHEQDFLVAYQGHMQKVYHDLGKMKAKVSE